VAGLVFKSLPGRRNQEEDKVCQDECQAQGRKKERHQEQEAGNESRRPRLFTPEPADLSHMLRIDQNMHLPHPEEEKIPYQEQKNKRQQNSRQVPERLPACRPLLRVGKISLQMIFQFASRMFRERFFSLMTNQAISGSPKRMPAAASPLISSRLPSNQPCCWAQPFPDARSTLPVTSSVVRMFTPMFLISVSPLG